MAVTYEVTYTDGRKVLAVASPRVEIAVEQQHFKLRDGRWLEWIYRLSWQALVFDGQESRSFEDFLLNVADITPQQQVGEEDPTPPARPLSDSSPSVLEPASASATSAESPGE